MRELQTNSHCKNLILYHLIFVCKYRRKCFSNASFAEDLKKQFVEIAKKYDFEIDTIDLDYSKPDHIHLLAGGCSKTFSSTNCKRSKAANKLLGLAKL